MREYVRIRTVGEQAQDLEQEAGGTDWFDPLLIETFGGPSYLVMVLGHSIPTDIDEVVAIAPALNPNDVRAGDFVDAIRASGRNFGVAASLRLAFLSLGARLSHAQYDQVSVTTVTGELALRAGGSFAEGYLGLGLGGGYLGGLPKERVSTTSGMALRVGLGLQIKLSKHVALGAGVDAVGLFIAGKGIRPGQLTEINMADTNHPLGIQIPAHIDVSVRL